MTRKLSENDLIRIRATMRLDPKPGGGYWLWPTNETVRLERELNGTADEARARVAAFLISVKLKNGG